MVTHRSFCTLAITRITVPLITLIVLPYSLVRAQIPKPQLPTGIPLSSGQASKKSSAGVVTDGFKAFDALKIAERIKLLFANGPYEESEHLTSDIKLRVLLYGESHILFQYGLPSDAFAELTISVPRMEPIFTRIDPARRARIEIAIPANYGPKPQVASLYIKARTNLNQPANIQIYELAMERDRAPDIRKAHAVSSGAKLAINTAGLPRRTGDEPLPLFDPGAVQNPSGVSMTISPVQIIAKTAPPMTFILTSTSVNYSSSRSEFWRTKGWNTTNVWLKKTGPISQTATLGNWDGTNFKNKPSIGFHFLKLVLWNGPANANVWTFAQSPLKLEVK
jgi:hypothetical protein